MYSYFVLYVVVGIRVFVNPTALITSVESNAYFGNSTTNQISRYNGPVQWPIACEGQDFLCGTVTSRLCQVRLSATEIVADISTSYTQETLSFTTLHIIKATLNSCELIITPRHAHADRRAWRRATGHTLCYLSK